MKKQNYCFVCKFLLFFGVIWLIFRPAYDLMHSSPDLIDGYIVVCCMVFSAACVFHMIFVGEQ